MQTPRLKASCLTSVSSHNKPPTLYIRDLSHECWGTVGPAFEPAQDLEYTNYALCTDHITSRPLPKKRQLIICLQIETFLKVKVMCVCGGVLLIVIPG